MTHLVEQVVSAISAVPAKMPPNSGNRAWTDAVKRGLIELAQLHGYKVCTSGHPELADNEWLYDLVWYTNGENGCLTSVPLVVESEWSPDFAYIRFDFEKLLLARSEIKVMVCQDYQGNLAQVFDLLRGGIASFDGDRAFGTYILAVYSNELGRFEIQTVPDSTSPAIPS